MCRKMGRMADQRSPQVFAGIRANTREPAQFARKKPQPRTVGVGVLVEAAGIELAFMPVVIGLQGMAAEMLPKTPIAIGNSRLFTRRLTYSLGLETSWKYGAMEFIDQLSPLFLAVTTACRGTDEKGCH